MRTEVHANDEKIGSVYDSKVNAWGSPSRSRQQSSNDPI